VRRGAAPHQGKGRLRRRALGLVEFIKPQRVNKALTGHFKKANVAPVKVLREVRIAESKDETKVGDRVLVENFKAGELVDVTGVSKGALRGRREALALCRRRRHHVRCFIARLAASAAVRIRRACGRTSTSRDTWATPGSPRRT